MDKAADGRSENREQRHESGKGGNMNLERFLEGFTEEERKLYETCMSLLQSIGEDGNLEEACEWLEKMAADKGKSSPTKPED